MSGRCLWSGWRCSWRCIAQHCSYIKYVLRRGDTKTAEIRSWDSRMLSDDKKKIEKEIRRVDTDRKIDRGVRRRSYHKCIPRYTIPDRLPWYNNPAWLPRYNIPSRLPRSFFCRLCPLSPQLSRHFRFMSTEPFWHIVFVMCSTAVCRASKFQWNEFWTSPHNMNIVI